ncbi:MAG: alpha/beta hydrolase, partial [Oscillospiraceae bacterium]|nr:alpha/beta hydrolase [Oscillospiraceae bacterium]
MRAGKRILAGVLAAVLLLGVLLVPVGAAGENYVVDKRPTIIIHGIGQSEAFLYDDAGNKVQQEDGSYLQGWPPVIDPMDIVAAVALPLIATLLFQFDFGLTSAMRKAVNNIFTLFKMDENGLPVQNMQVQRYPNSVAETDEAGQNFIYNSIPLQGLADVIGPENLYYFAYDSFGNNAAVTKELYEMIQRIKTEKGVDKVNLIPISLGGTIMNSLVATYPDV